MKPNPPLPWFLKGLLFGGLAPIVGVVYLLSDLPFWVSIIICAAGYVIHGALMYGGSALKGRRADGD